MIKMKVLNYGSLNYDYVYLVKHMVQLGETISSSGMEIHFGGKGLNQSIALARAGADVYHAGMVGEDGEDLIAVCEKYGVHTDYITRQAGKSGHAVIQITPEGENCIILYSGSNGKNTEEKIEEVLAGFEEGDLLLLQNEINLLDLLVKKAYERKMKIVLNPSPMNEKILSCDLKKVSLFLLNEVEGEQLTGETEADRILSRMRELYPNAEVVLTLGKEGSRYAGPGLSCACDSFPVEAVDTTAAGDTFTGYYIASVLCGKSIEKSLKTASAASGLAVTRKGAVPSIPGSEEVEDFLKKYAR